MQRHKRHEKLICERQRRGSGKRYHDFRHIKGTAINDDIFDYEEEDVTMAAPRLIEPMRRPYKQHWAEKEFSDFTSPIRGFIRKNVGRVWNDVFSEFCEQYDQRSILTKHLYLHIKQHVCTKVKDIDGVLTVCNSYSGVIPLEKSHEDYYVDPRDGILKYNQYYVSWKQNRKEYNEAAAAKRALTVRIVDRFHEYHLIKGTWFLITIVELPGKKVEVKHTTLYNNRTIYYTAIEYPKKYDIIKQEVVDGKRYAATKRTASKKEIRDYKLNNLVEETLVA